MTRFNEVCVLGMRFHVVWVSCVKVLVRCGIHVIRFNVVCILGMCFHVVWVSCVKVLVRCGIHVIRFQCRVGSWDVFSCGVDFIFLFFFFSSLLLFSFFFSPYCKAA